MNTNQLAWATARQFAAGNECTLTTNQERYGAEYCPEGEAWPSIAIEHESGDHGVLDFAEGRNGGVLVQWIEPVTGDCHEAEGTADGLIELCDAFASAAYN